MTYCDACIPGKYNDLVSQATCKIAIQDSFRTKMQQYYVQSALKGSGMLSQEELSATHVYAGQIRKTKRAIQNASVVLREE